MTYVSRPIVKKSDPEEDDWDGFTAEADLLTEDDLLLATGAVIWCPASCRAMA